MRGESQVFGGLGVCLEKGEVSKQINDKYGAL